MAIYPYTLLNPSAETGTTSWTTRSGGTIARGNGDVTPRPGNSWYFIATSSGATAKWDQQIAVDAGHVTAVDTGVMLLRGAAFHMGWDGDTDSGQLYVECIAADGTTILGRQENSPSDPTEWTMETVQMTVPTGTRFFRIGTNNTRVTGTQLSTYWDNFELDLADAGTEWVTNARITSVGVETLFNPSASPTRVSQITAETIYSSAATPARLTTFAVEVLYSIPVAPAPPVASRRRMSLM